MSMGNFQGQAIPGCGPQMVPCSKLSLRLDLPYTLLLASISQSLLYAASLWPLPSPPSIPCAEDNL